MSALPQFSSNYLDTPASATPRPVHGPSSTPLLVTLWQWLTATWSHLRQQGSQLGLLKPRQRRLRVSETLSLGDKRSVSILEVDGQSFLLGSSSTGLSLLATLPPPTPPQPPFEQVLHESLVRGDA